MERIAANESTDAIAAQIDGLTTYQERLRTARTWPYNTGMLRTLFVSVLVAVGAALAQVLLELLLR